MKKRSLVQLLFECRDKLDVANGIVEPYEDGRLFVSASLLRDLKEWEAALEQAMKGAAWRELAEAASRVVDPARSYDLGRPYPGDVESLRQSLAKIAGQDFALVPRRLAPIRSRRGRKASRRH